MPSDPLPLSPLDKEWERLLKQFEGHDGGKYDQKLIREARPRIEQEARTLARAEVLDVDVLARALVGPLEHDLGYMPWDEQKPEGWRWTSLAADIAAAYAAALSRLGERE